jgi:hypothetical protein
MPTGTSRVDNRLLVPMPDLRPEGNPAWPVEDLKRVFCCSRNGTIDLDFKIALAIAE